MTPHRLARRWSVPVGLVEFWHYVGEVFIMDGADDALGFWLNAAPHPDEESLSWWDHTETTCPCQVMGTDALSGMALEDL